MKRSIAIGIFLIILTVPSIAQSASELGLVLRGTTVSGRPCERRNENLRCYAFRMVFENKGKEPVIILNPTLGYGTGIKEILFYYRELNRDTHSYKEVEG